ncbi:pilus assembly protein [Sphingosinicella sp. LHD-64]|uniref:TadE/TadG family type IV pilus assembly protein n=1 Tax=Sphingosinicella sp. LHD-64 TaxID=3072139 RepID=UPI0028107B79|nr:pilus assembly protein [Sphingosinicella sp. LHD-64]MDQ8757096.1 pilus assembly protein [Sphingosinicella sp. LHD-64]
MTEFAFALPLMLLVGMTGMEMANYAMARMRVSNISVMTADGAARIRDSIDEADVVELMNGAKMTGDGIGFAQNGRIILYSIELSADGTRQWIRWQRCVGALRADPSYGRPLTASGATIANGTEIFAANRTSVSANPSSPDRSTATAVGPNGNQIAARAGTAIMMAEVVYNYQPIIPASPLAGRQIRHQNAFNVRQRVDQSLRNLGRITPRSCDTYQA